MLLRTRSDNRSKHSGFALKRISGSLRSHAIQTAVALLFIATLCWTGTMSAGGGVGVLKSKALGPYNVVEKAFNNEVKGDPTVYDMEAQMEKGKISLAEILSQNPACIHVIGTHAARVASFEKVSVPVIFSMILDPEALDGIRGIVAGCFALPSPNELFASFKRINPDAKKIGAVYDPKWTEFLVERGFEAAQEQGMELVAEKVTDLKGTLKALDMVAETTDAIWMLPDRTVLSSQSLKHMLLLSFRRKVPLLAISEKYVAKGAFLALRMDYAEIGKQAGRMANQILKNGEIEGHHYAFAENNQMVLNLNTAEKLDIKVPRKVLDEALVVKQ